MINYRNLIFGGSQYQTSGYRKTKALGPYIRNMVTMNQMPARGYKDKVANIYDGTGTRVYRGKIAGIPKSMQTYDVDNRSRNGYDKDTKEVTISLVKEYVKRKRR